MARKSSPTILQEELYPPPGELERESLDDARLVDLDVEEESPFLRGQKRVSARRPPLPKRAVNGLKWSVIALVVLFLAGIAGTAAYHYGERNWRFRIDSSDNIEITGTHNVPHAQVMEVLGGDIGRNIFFVPLTERKAQLEKVPWVESASVMRFVPNRLVVDIHERTPIAFARLGSRIALIDAGGTLMELPGAGKQKYSFPVIVGMNPGEPISTRAARMKIYNELLRQLDSDGGHYSQDLSEVDISDQEDVKVLANDPAGAVLVHLGASEFLSRYKIYVTHVQAWRQQFEKLESVDLRYDHQIIVNPDTQGGAKAPEVTPAVAKAAMAAGVKPAALIHVIPVKPAAPKPAAMVTPASATKTIGPAPDPSAKGVGKPASKPATRKAVHKTRRRAWRKKSAAKTTAAARASGPKPAARQQATSPAKSTMKASAGGASEHSAPGKKKPSAAVAKNQDQQDRR
jgi:cell division protein FtsQ